MNKVKNQAAQGDMLIRRVDKIPDGLEQAKAKAEGKLLILAHSETGHHHAVTAEPGVIMFNSPDSLVSFLRVPKGKSIDIVHYRAWDTHAPLTLDEGCYEIRRQREHAPEGWRRVAD